MTNTEAIAKQRSEFTLDNIPAELRALACILMTRDGIDAFDAWRDVISPALDDLSERLVVADGDGEAIDAASFMREHFDLEPEHFAAMLDHIENMLDRFTAQLDRLAE